MNAGPVEEDAHPAEADPEARRPRDAATALPILGFLLFSPPVMGIFAVDATVLGAPASVVFIFLIWAGLIALAFWLSRALPARDVDDGA